MVWGAAGAWHVSISGHPRHSGYRPGPSEVRESPFMSTRTLLVLAAITGVAILIAGAVQILLAR